MPHLLKTWKAPVYKISIIKIVINFAILIPYFIKPEMVESWSLLIVPAWILLVTSIYKKFDKVKYNLSFPYNKQILFFQQHPAVYSIEGNMLIINRARKIQKISLADMEGFSQYVSEYEAFCVLPEYKVFYLHKKWFFLKQYKPIVVPIEQEEEIKEILSESLKFLDKNEAIKDQKPNCFMYFLIFIVSLFVLAFLFLIVADSFFNIQF